MSLINCKVKLKLKSTKHSLLAADGKNNTNGNSNDIIFTINDTKSAKENQKLSKLLNKGFERLVYWNECKTESENRNTLSSQTL